MTREWDFGWDFTGGWHMSSGCHPHVIRTLAWVAQFHGVLHLVSSACYLQTHMSSTHHPHVICTLSACHLHVICTHMSSACHPHVIRTLPWVAQFHAVLHLVSSAHHLQTHMSSAHHLQICTAFAQSSWTPFVFPVPKTLVIDVTVVPDVVPNVALLKTYCLHIIPSSLCCPYGPQFGDLLSHFEKYYLLMSLWFLMWFLMWSCLRHIVCTASVASLHCPYGPQLSNFLSQKYYLLMSLWFLMWFNLTCGPI